MKKTSKLLKNKKLVILLSAIGVLMVGATSYLLYNNYVQEKASNAGTVVNCAYTVKTIQSSCGCKYLGASVKVQKCVIPSIPSYCGTAEYSDKALKERKVFVQNMKVSDEPGEQRTCGVYPGFNQRCVTAWKNYNKAVGDKAYCNKLVSDKNTSDRQYSLAVARACSVACIVKPATVIAPPPNSTVINQPTTTTPTKPSNTAKKPNTTKPSTTTPKSTSGQEAKINRWEKTDY